MKLLKEFKEFAVKGNVIDMAVGIIIGLAFGKVVTSMVGDIIMPTLGLIISGIDFSQLAITLNAASGDSEAVIISYGKFIQTIVDFTIIAFAIFLMIKAINSLRRKEEAKNEPPAEPVPSREELLLAEIRDLLKTK